MLSRNRNLCPKRASYHLFWQVHWPGKMFYRCKVIVQEMLMGAFVFLLYPCATAPRCCLSFKFVSTVVDAQLTDGFFVEVTNLISHSPSFTSFTLNAVWPRTAWRKVLLGSGTGSLFLGQHSWHVHVSTSGCNSYSFLLFSAHLRRSPKTLGSLKRFLNSLKLLPKLILDTMFHTDFWVVANLILYPMLPSFHYEPAAVNSDCFYI